MLTAPASLLPCFLVPCSSVVVRATQVVPAVRAHQLASMSRQTMRARRADLAVMIYGGFVRIRRANHTIAGGTRSNLIIENTGPLGKHGSEINSFFTVPAMPK